MIDRSGYGSNDLMGISNGFSGGGFNPASFGNSLGQFISGFTNDSARPYIKGSDRYGQLAEQGKNYQNPFFQFGREQLPNYGNWLESMKNPTDFINNIMGQYQESPFAHYQQQQAQRAGTNAASASGLIGSTPFAQQLQQNAGNIASQDQNNWLQNVLGINTQYGQGLGGAISGGQHAGDILTQLQQMLAEYQGGAAYGQAAGEGYDRSNRIGGGLGILSSIFGA